MTKIVPGKTIFHAYYADGNPSWKVLYSRGEGVWVCQITADDLDFAGTRKLFSTEEIEGSLQFDEAFVKLSNDNDAFYASLKLGQIIHYNNGFDQWVRCEVVNEAGENKLKPIALVGGWRSYDLPGRTVTGEIRYPYHAEQIVKGETFTPHYSNVWESGKVTEKSDPTQLTPISLEVPPMTPEEIARAALWQKVINIREVMEGDDPQLILDKISSILQ